MIHVFYSNESVTDWILITEKRILMLFQSPLRLDVKAMLKDRSKSLNTEKERRFSLRVDRVMSNHLSFSALTFFSGPFLKVTPLISLVHWWVWFEGIPLPTWQVIHLFILFIVSVFYFLNSSTVEDSRILRFMFKLLNVLLMELFSPGMSLIG